MNMFFWLEPIQHFQWGFTSPEFAVCFVFFLCVSLFHLSSFSRHYRWYALSCKASDWLSNVLGDQLLLLQFSVFKLVIGNISISLTFKFVN